MELNRQRITVVDGICGVRLLGVLMANVLIFQYGLWGKDELHLFSPSLLDISTYSFLKLMVEGSFMPIFTFLFGFSMVKLKESLERRDWPSSLSFGYIFLLSILCHTRWFTYFECVGKLSITNYVMQTIIYTTIFYGYGLGLFGKIGILSGILLSFLIFSLQMVASFWYLRFFNLRSN